MKIKYFINQTIKRHLVRVRHPGNTYKAWMDFIFFFFLVKMVCKSINKKI